MKFINLLNLSNTELNSLLKETKETEFYDKLTQPGFSTKNTFSVRIPFRIGNKKTDVEIPIDIDESLLKKEIDQYLTASPELKKQFDVSVYWYDNFSDLIFKNLPEADACMFLAACAYTSVNTGLDQNVLQASKLLISVKHDFASPNGKQYLRDLISRVKENDSNESLAFIKQYVDKGSEYAKLSSHKLDYKGGMSKMGHKKGQEDVFSEVTVSNAKLPNFHSFVKYYLDNDGKVTRDQLFKDVQSGKMKISGTKITSFFLNLVFPGYLWGEGDNAIDPATVDRWMIMVFFEIPLLKMVNEDVIEWIEYVTDNNQTEAKGITKTPEEMALESRRKALIDNKDKIVLKARDQLFSSDEVRQNLVKILHEEAKKVGLKSYQLQALAWVNIRDRHGEPHSRFATYEQVMAFAKESADGILQLDPNINDVTKTIHILANAMRFSGVNKQDTIDTITNRSGYTMRFFLPPKADVESKAKKKIALDALTWNNVRVVLKTETTADILDFTKKSVKNGAGQTVMKPKHKNPVVGSVTGTNRADTLSKALRWVINYNPDNSDPVA